ncbi:ATPase H(+)-transporting accessory protein 2 [Atheta coriaria]|uniref:ATPase H(+)-transporting accessory protein 2 n=1 Tax=Dalotia coriaria TaxID=877792 RepID=UPI0031F35F55
MWSSLLCFSAVILSVYATGEFSVLKHPASVSFKGHDHIKQSLLPEVYSACIGFTTEQDSNWQGMYLSDPFDLAKAVVTVAIDGIPNTGLMKGHHFPMKTDEDEAEVYNVMAKRFREHYPNANNDVRVVLSKGLYEVEDIEAFLGVKNIKPIKPTSGALKMSVEEDRQFLEEMSFLNALVESIKSASLKPSNAPQLIWFKIESLHALSDLHGENSTATKEAKRMMNQAIEDLSAAYDKLYDGKVLINVISSDASHTRRVRRATKEGEDELADLNLAPNYTSDYPVIFNIILWFGVAMFFSLLAICMFIGNMDPGRDSIIYRMTSTRMKKDN